MVIVAVLIAIIVGGIYAFSNQNEQRQAIPLNVGIDGSCIRPLHTHDGSGRIHVETDVDRDYVLGDFFLLWGKELNSNGVFSRSQPLPSHLDRCLPAGEGSTLVYHSHPTLEIIFKRNAPSTITMTVNGNPEPLLENYVLPRSASAVAKIVITYGPGVPAAF